MMHALRKPDTIEWLYLDFDSFFASIEQHLDANLRGRPVGVVPIQSNATCIIAASREAKHYGIKTGTSVREARQLCPSITLPVARHDVYVRIHQRIVTLVNQIVPVHGVRSIDEVCCHLLHNEQLRARDIAHHIKTALVYEFSPVLTCSIGFGPNELLAKVAAEMNKPNGLVILNPSDLPHKILSLQLTDLPGISKGYAARLRQADVTTIQGLWNLAPKQARAIWGSVEGERFHALLQGYDIPRLSTQRRMFGHSRVLPWAWRELAPAQACACLLLVKAAARMRREGFFAHTLMLSFKGQNGERWTLEEHFKTAICDDHSSLNALTRLFANVHKSCSVQRFKSVQVVFYNLSQSQGHFDLFEPNDQRRVWEHMSHLTDRLNARYGRVVLSLGSHLQPPGGYAGGKIAFGRIPEGADFHV